VTTTTSTIKALAAISPTTMTTCTTTIIRVYRSHRTPILHHLILLYMVRVQGPCLRVPCQQTRSRSMALSQHSPPGPYLPPSAPPSSLIPCHHHPLSRRQSHPPAVAHWQLPSRPVHQNDLDVQHMTSNLRLKQGCALTVLDPARSRYVWYSESLYI
jgi:hypothetical protein